MGTFIDWLKSREPLTEGNTRYSVEVNFRTSIDEVLESYARIALGFVSAALKSADYHVKQIFDDGLIRILVSSRNWDDGEWVVVVSWNPHHRCFFLTPGFYDRMNRQVSYKKQAPQRCDSDNPSEITRQVKSLMHSLKQQPDRHIQKLKRVPLKRGPKK